MKKIAFCFLIYDKINLDELWKLFFKDVNKNKYNIYIHYKTDKPLVYFDKYKIQNCINTNYEDQTIPLAYNILFRHAYIDDVDNYKFIIVSGACIPFKSFDYIYTQLTKDEYGYFNVSPKSQCFPNCDSLINSIDENFISKSHNWFILNRILVEKLCFDKDDILNLLYSKVYAPAEYFYYTFIKLMSLESKIITTPNLSNDATTFTNWSNMGYKYSSDHGLKNYDTIDKEELLYLLNSKCLFGRKFTANCYSQLYIKEYIETITTKNEYTKIRTNYEEIFEDLKNANGFYMPHIQNELKSRFIIDIADGKFESNPETIIELAKKICNPLFHF